MPVLAPAASFYEYVLAIHILGAVIGLGSVFAFPLLFAAAARVDPQVTPWLLRTRQRVGRYLVNPGLTVVLVAGIYLATDLHQWSYFYVQWGIGAVVVIGAIEGSLVIPRSGRLAAIAERDLAAAATPAGAQRVSATWSREYVRWQRLVWLGGSLIQLLVVITVFLMAIRAGA